MTKPVQPEDVVPDGVDYVMLNGQKVRKGSVGALLANIEIIENDLLTSTEHEQALQAIVDLVPSIKAIGLNKFVTFNNEIVQKLFEKSNL